MSHRFSQTRAVLEQHDVRARPQKAALQRVAKAVVDARFGFPPELTFSFARIPRLSPVAQMAPHKRRGFRQADKGEILRPNSRQNTQLKLGWHRSYGRSVAISTVTLKTRATALHSFRPAKS